MTDERIEKDVPSRDEAPSPTENDGTNYRLLIVANRLPITIKKQLDVCFAISCVNIVGQVQIQGFRGWLGHRVVWVEEENVVYLDRMDW